MAYRKKEPELIKPNILNEFGNPAHPWEKDGLTILCPDCIVGELKYSKTEYLFSGASCVVYACDICKSRFEMKRDSFNRSIQGLIRMNNVFSL